VRRGAPSRRPAAAPPEPAPAPAGSYPGLRPAPGRARAAEASAKEHGALGAWVRILAVHKRGLAVVRDHLEREITLPRFDLLANLAREDGQTLASLSRSMLVTAGNLTGLVDRAARDGLVERRADPDDRRAWRVHITPKGQRAFRNAERRHAARVSKLFEAFTPAELGALVRLLDKLRAALRAPDADERPTARVRPLPAVGAASARRRSRKKLA
jgi:DNA-binding MarR family transcriptional regulator